MPQTIIDLLNKGIKANNTDKFRRGNLIHLPADGSLVVTGDLHGHRRNFERITTFADLANNPDRHIALQEIIHGGPQDSEVRCNNRIWLSHSLPSDHFVDKFDRQILDRPLKNNDMVKPGSAYLLTWGRKHSQTLLDEMAKLLDVDIFILGHQPQQQGWYRAGNNLIIIASDHNHGCLLPVDLAKSYTIEELIDSIVPLTSIP